MSSQLIHNICPLTASSSFKSCLNYTTPIFIDGELPHKTMHVLQCFTTGISTGAELLVQLVTPLEQLLCFLLRLSVLCSLYLPLSRRQAVLLAALHRWSGAAIGACFRLLLHILGCSLTFIRCSQTPMEEAASVSSADRAKASERCVCGLRGAPLRSFSISNIGPNRPMLRAFIFLCMLSRGSLGKRPCWQSGASWQHGKRRCLLEHWCHWHWNPMEVCTSRAAHSITFEWGWSEPNTGWSRSSGIVPAHSICSRHHSRDKHGHGPHHTLVGVVARTLAFSCCGIHA
mmetsp:Transcript_49478/g.117763  ORF Transcript_49478/g.117763 Transcript_49478/m.117763 type:complete len:287 (-) Transcript_49478:110-970(-)